MTIIDKDIQKLELLKGAKFLHAFIECSDAIQQSVCEMLEVLCDSDVDEDDRDMALFTLADCLFPNLHDGKLGMDLEDSEKIGAVHSKETRDCLEELDKEESTFATRLKDVMSSKNVTQEDLAKLVGVNQSAISNMLNRQCRPQKRTVLRFAEALSISPDALWPTFNQPHAG